MMALGDIVSTQSPQMLTYVNSCHHLAQKYSILNTLIHCAEMISDGDSLQAELNHLKSVFVMNGYSSAIIQQAIIQQIL